MIIVYGVGGCKGCDEVMHFLHMRNVAARLVDPARMPAIARGRIPEGWIKSPMCFDNNTFVGSFSDLKRYLGVPERKWTLPPGQYVVYGRSGCGYTQSALELLASVGAKHTYHGDSGASMSPAEKQQARHHKTVPMVFLNGAFVGGFSELDEMKT